MPLTDTKIRSLRATGKVQKKSDGGGLYVFVSEKGTILWRMNYRFGGKQKTLCFGEYPAVSLSQARLLREQAKQALASGEDPGAMKQQRKAEEQAESRTFKAVALEWYDVKTPEWSQKYREVVMMRLERYVFPEIGRIPVAGLRTAHVRDALKKIKANYTAHRISGLIGQICDYAHLCEYCEANVAAGLTKTLQKHVEKHQAAILDPGKLGEFMRRLEHSRSYRQMRYALRLLPYVFLRNSELRGGEWAEVDLDAALWVISARRMKMGKDHVIPLASQVVEIFRELKRCSGDSPYLFPSSIKGDKPISDNGLLKALRNLGYEKDEITVHGFRATASTLLNGMNFNPDVIEAQLAHKEEDRVRAAYNRNEYLDQRRQMMQAWADYLDKLKGEADGRLQK